MTAGLGMANAIFQGERSSASQIFYAAGANAKQDSFELTAEKKLSLKVAVRTEQFDDAGYLTGHDHRHAEDPAHADPGGERVYVGGPDRAPVGDGHRGRCLEGPPHEVEAVGVGHEPHGEGRGVDAAGEPARRGADGFQGNGRRVFHRGGPLGRFRRPG